MLQADSPEMFEAWISSMQKGIGAAIQHSVSCDDSANDDSKISGKLNSSTCQVSENRSSNATNESVKPRKVK